MKLARKLLLSVMLFGLGFWVSSMVIPSNADSMAQGNQPGSVNDPLITKSYLDEQIKGLVQAEISKQTGSIHDGASDARELVVVELNPGETLYASAGSEFIVRNGKAVSVSANTNGVLDVTDGKDLRSGALIPNHHLLLFPREDGRGIKPHETETQTIFVMVRGVYLHVDKDGNPVQS